MHTDSQQLKRQSRDGGEPLGQGTGARDPRKVNDRTGATPQQCDDHRKKGEPAQAENDWPDSTSRSRLGGVSHGLDG